MTAAVISITAVFRNWLKAPAKAAWIFKGRRTNEWLTIEVQKKKLHSEYIEKVVSLNRVSKTVKGGRIYKFAALVVVGDGKGKVGYGLGKAAEVSEAILQGHCRRQEEHGHRLPCPALPFPTRLSASSALARVLMKPASTGTGVIAGGAVRAVMEAAGITNIRAKCLRSNNPAERGQGDLCRV